MSNLFEKLPMKRLFSIKEEKYLKPEFQFGFRENHVSIELVQTMLKKVSTTLQKKEIV